MATDLSVGIAIINNTHDTRVSETSSQLGATTPSITLSDVLDRIGSAVAVFFKDIAARVNKFFNDCDYVPMDQYSAPSVVKLQQEKRVEEQIKKNFEVLPNFVPDEKPKSFVRGISIEDKAEMNKLEHHNKVTQEYAEKKVAEAKELAKELAKKRSTLNFGTARDDEEAILIKNQDRAKVKRPFKPLLFVNAKVIHSHGIDETKKEMLNAKSNQLAVNKEKSNTGTPVMSNGMLTLASRVALGAAVIGGALGGALYVRKHVQNGNVLATTPYRFGTDLAMQIGSDLEKANKVVRYFFGEYAPEILKNFMPGKRDQIQ